MLRTTTCAAIALSLTLTTSVLAGQTPEARTLSLSFDADGRVTLSARNVTVRDILAEWARQCGCYVVNADKLSGDLLTIPVQFDSAPQSAVLKSLLRDAAGYVLTPKPAGGQTASNYETIYILATSNPVAGAYVPPPPALAGPPLPTMGSPDDEIPPVMPAGMMPDPRQEPAQPAAQPTSSNPFGSRTSDPNVFRPGNAFGSGGNTGTTPTPGAPTPAPPGTVGPPPTPMPTPSGISGPTPSGAPVSIIPVPQNR